MSHNYRKNLYVFTAAILTMSAAALGFAGQTLTGDQVKALIADKTVSVERVKDGANWKVYFAADGSSSSSGAVSGDSTWYVDDEGRHCNEGAKLKCAPVVDNGDGTYARLKPNGTPAVMWKNIVGGKNL